MPEAKDYRGQKHVEGQSAVSAPPAPLAALAAGIPAGTGTYAQVTMIGHYGLACAQDQTLRFRNVSLAQARQIKWDNFGVCGAQMTCFDNQGNVVHEE